MAVPERPKIYHIVHVDRLPSIIANGGLLCDSEVVQREIPGTAIGMSNIKARRLNELTLVSLPHLHVGDCVPFYFCPRSIMLYLINQANHPELTYHGGQEPIAHLEADFYASIEWAKESQRGWVFTLSNAGAYYFEDRNSLEQLNEINWEAVHTHRWGGQGVSSDVKEGKQAEFLMEQHFPWHLIERVGVRSGDIYQQVMNCLGESCHRPVVEVRTDWYYG